MTPATLRPASYDDLNALCRGITTSFVHLETRDAYGTEVELPHMAKWRRGEADDFAWLGWWLEMLRAHRAADRTCRRGTIGSDGQPASLYATTTMAPFAASSGDSFVVPLPRAFTMALAVAAWLLLA